MARILHLNRDAMDQRQRDDAEWEQFAAGIIDRPDLDILASDDIAPIDLDSITRAEIDAMFGDEE